MMIVLQTFALSAVAGAGLYLGALAADALCDLARTLRDDRDRWYL